MVSIGLEKVLNIFSFPFIFISVIFGDLGAWVSYPTFGDLGGEAIFFTGESIGPTWSGCNELAGDIILTE